MTSDKSAPPKGKGQPRKQRSTTPAKRRDHTPKGFFALGSRAHLKEQTK